jgi:peroxiredoxin
MSQDGAPHRGLNPMLEDKDSFEENHEGAFLMSKWKLMVLMFGLVLVGIAVAACSASVSKAEQSRTAKSPNSDGTVVGDTAPDFQLAGLNGEQLKLADLRGQPAVLIFWTAWCPVCKEEAPHFNQLAATYEPKGVQVVGINIQDSPARTEGGVKEFGIQYRVVRDADATVTRRYKGQWYAFNHFSRSQGSSALLRQ